MTSTAMSCLRQARLPGLLRRFAAAAVLASGLLPFAGMAATIDNTASVRYELTGNPYAVTQKDSNTSSTVTLPLPSPSVVTFHQYAPPIAGFTYPDGAVQSYLFDGGEYDSSGAGNFTALAGVVGWDWTLFSHSAPINLAAPVPVRATDTFHAGDPVFITLADSNRNADPALREFITLRLVSSTGDEEILRMQETGPDTGVFAAVIQSVGGSEAVADNNGRISVAANSSLRVEYVDDSYLAPMPVDAAEALAMVDPFGVVFDTRTGQPVNGATLTLVDLSTGLPATTVRAEDGVTAFPGQVISGPGNDAGDALLSGASAPAQGQFRFPLIPPGNYRFEILAPANYVVPSTVPDAAMPPRPGSVLPYAVTAGSRGEAFVVLPGPALEIDVPVDPLSTRLVLQKNVSTSEASVGDLLQYQLIVTNDDTALEATAAQVIDRLPEGFVYRSGSLRINGARVAEPAISADRRTLTIPLGDLAAGATVKVTYVVALAANVRAGNATNVAQADANAGDLFSNIARATVKVREVLMTGRSTLIGRVYEGGCDVPFEQLKGVPNVRIVLDDGSYTITDADGQYHFEAVRPGVHVVQMDVESLPGSHVVQQCIDNTRFAGKPYSQFVDVQAGSLWRADFHTHRRVDNVAIRMNSDLETEETVYTPPPKRKVKAAVFREREVKNYTLKAEFDSCRDTLKAEGQTAVDDLILDLKQERIERIEVTGNTDNQRLSARCQKLYADNYVLSEARARRVGDALAAALNLKPEQVVNIGKGPDNPVAENTSPEGMQRNRRTDLKVFLLPDEVAQDDEPEFEEAPAPIRTITVKGMTHRIEVDGSIPVKDLRVMANIPEGYAYTPVSARVDGVAGIGASESGGTLLFRLGDIPGENWKHVIEFATEAVKQDALKTRDVEEHRTIRPNFDSCSPALKPDGELIVKRMIREFRDIDAERMEVQVHTDNGPLSKTCAKKYDVYSLAKARAQTIADAVSSALGIPPERVVVRGIGPDAPMMSNSTEEGRQLNRRTEVYVEGKLTEMLKADQLKPACETQPFVLRSVATFESLHKKKQKTPPVENALACGEEAAKKIQAAADAKAAKAAAEAARAAAALRAEADKAAAARAAEEKAVAAAIAQADAVEAAAAGEVAGAAATEPAADAVTPAASADAPAVQQGEPAADAPAAPVAAPAIDPKRSESARESVSVEGGLVKTLPPSVLARMKKRSEIVDEAEASGANADWLSGQKPGREWLFPKPGYNPRGPVTRIVIKHGPRDTVRLLRGDGDPVSALNFEGTVKSADKKMTASIWRGVPIEEGKNEFVAEITDAETGNTERMPGTVVYAGSPASAEFVPEQSVLMADGYNKPVVAVRLRDREGNPIRAGMTGSIQVSAPYLLAQHADMLNKRQLAGVDRFTPQYRVEGDEGIAYVELAPTTDSGAVTLSFNFAMGEDMVRTQDIRAWLEPSSREWIIVGFAQGTAGFNTLKDNIAALQADGMEDGGYTDGQVSLYAKGAIKGEWLMTMAYDTDKDASRRQGVLSQIDPEKYFTIYGDGSTERHDAPSQSKLYLKLEKGQFYALFGDYDTGLTQTELSRYSRVLNGIKVEKGDGRVRYVVFAAETPQNSARDDIQGNGTSGLYHLSRGNIVVGSERVRIETRDRIHADKIVQTKVLARYLDYDLDYDDGTLWFRQPVPSRDPSFNPNFIVVEYETLGVAEQQLNAGGRVAATLDKAGRAEVGVTAIRDENSNGSRTLEGIDATLRVGSGSTVRAEVAGSGGEQGNVAVEGDAWLLEYEHHNGKYDTRVYTQRNDTGFGVEQTSALTGGQQKSGAEGRMRLNREWSLEGDAYAQEDLDTEATRNALKAAARYTQPDWSASFGAQVIDDQGPVSAVTNMDSHSEQLTGSVERWFLNRKLQLSAEGDAALGSQKGSVDYPNRITLGANYALNESTRLLAGQEFTDGSEFDNSTTRVGIETVPWKGARLGSTLNQSQMSESGERTFAQYGLTQGVLLNDRWGLDFSLDANETLSRSGAPSQTVNNSNFPVANGGTSGLPTLTEDFQAVSAGATWREEIWSWNGRTEWRHSSSADKYGVVSNFLRQAKAGVAFASGFQLFKTEQETASDGLLATLDLSWAWRPLDSHWSFLDRLEFRYDEVENGTGVTGGSLFGNTSLNTTGDARSRRIVNNFALNRVSRQWTGSDRKGNLFSRYERNQFSVYYGSKYQIDTFDGVDYDGYTDLLGVEVRHDITRSIDVGVQASVLNQWSGGTHKHSFGPNIGWSPIENGWITLGYNHRGYTDEDFDAARYAGQGFYLQVRVKFDQNTRIGRKAKAESAEQVNPAVQALLPGRELGAR